MADCCDPSVNDDANDDANNDANDDANDVCGGEVSCCVPSEGICLCLVPSQDSRRERSNNFQAFVKMALETLLGSCRRKHGGPRGRQG